MLPKDVDWRALSHCDGQAVRAVIEYGGRDAMTVLRLKPNGAFLKQCEKDQLLSTCFAICLVSYKSLSGVYGIRHDDFGGYRMIYVGQVRIRARDLFPSSPLGFLTAIPDNITDLSVFRKKSMPGVSFLLLGAVRFVNSDCNPNAEFDFGSDQKVVKLRSLKTILPGTEILVKYSDDFFECYSCHCATCKSSSAFDTLNRLYADNLLSELIKEELFDVADCHLRDTAIKRSKAVSQHSPKRLYWADKIRAFADAYESSDISCNMSTSEENLNCTLEEPSFDQHLDMNRHCSELTKRSPPPSTFEADSVKISSPLSNKSFESPHFSEIASTVASDFILPTAAESSLQQMSRPLYSGFEIGFYNATLLLRHFCSKLHLSDTGMLRLYDLLNCLLPEENCFSAKFSFIHKMKKTFK